MNYLKIYNKIIEYRIYNLPVGYSEKHHILPKCLGGKDTSDNLVKLTAREHYICHLLLVNIYKHDFNKYSKMINAFLRMCCNSTFQDRAYNSHTYDTIRKHWSSIMSKRQIGKNNIQYDTQWIYNPATKECIRIPKNQNIPKGWYSGRIIKHWPIPCVICGNYTKTSKHKYCSKGCRKHSKIKSLLIDKESIFLELYDKTKSMNAALKEMGYKGAVGKYHIWAKNVIQSRLIHLQQPNY